MKDTKDILSRVVHWTTRNRSHVSPINDLDGTDSKKSTVTAETIIDNLELAFDLAEQALDIAGAAPFIGPAAKLLSSLIASYKQVESTNEKCDVLATHIADLTGDLCATTLRMEAIKYSDIVGRLKSDLDKYAALIETAMKFVDEYDQEKRLVRVVARSQFGDEIDKLNQDLDKFGARFRTNRLVDLTISQSLNTKTLNRMCDMAVEKKLEKWLLNPPDMTQKHHDTEKLRADGTGAWLLAGGRFINWQDNAGFLWLEGPSGVGKSVLSSAVIKKLSAENQTLFSAGITSVPALAYFYFDFRHDDRRSAEIALRRLVLQLSEQSPHPYDPFNEEHDPPSKFQTIPTLEELHGILEAILVGFSRTYIILDGLDECDDLDQVTDVVSRLRTWTKTPLHLFISSQTRAIFRERFEAAEVVHFDTTEGDIHRFVTHELHTRDKLKVWRKHTARIADEVTRKSKGMFRLAAMLLIELSKCKLLHKLDETLKNLPEDLVAVYDRFCERISKAERIYADAVLRWIVFSSDEWPFKPLTLEELSDAIAFDFSDSTIEYYTHIPGSREFNRMAILEWLEGLIVEVRARVGRDSEIAVALSHASVQEYLLSTHFAKNFGHADNPFNDGFSHRFIARTCICYLLCIGDHPVDRITRQNYPLARYAATWWCWHLLRSDDRTVLFAGAMRLLRDGSPQFNVMARLYEHDTKSVSLGDALDSPLQFCVQEAYIEGVWATLASNPDSVNLVGERSYTSVLAIAARDGYTDIAHVLLKHGADINFNSPWGSPLRAAACGNHVETLRLLVDWGAAGNLKYWAEALTTASEFGHSGSVRFLLDCGVDIHTAAPYYQVALQRAVKFGRHSATAINLVLQPYPNGRDLTRELEMAWTQGTNHAE